MRSTDRRSACGITTHCNGPPGRNGPYDSNAARRPRTEGGASLLFPFSHLADSLDFHWTTLFALHAPHLPHDSIRQLAKLPRTFFTPFDNLPPDVLFVARDVDSACQDYAFRDDWMFKSVTAQQLHRGPPAPEVTSWPHASNEPS